MHTSLKTKARMTRVTRPLMALALAAALLSAHERRGATGTLATGQLALLDGRSLYQDFFGFVMWDFLPVNFNEVKQVEVIRGPASAVWGANAVNGVVNVITKSPREAPGTSVSITAGGFSRDAG